MNVFFVNLFTLIQWPLTSNLDEQSWMKAKALLYFQLFFVNFTQL